MTFKPMLAGKVDFDFLQYPVLGSPKLDGIRATVVGGKLLTRTLKEVPNRYIFDSFSHKEYEGLDGELIVGSPTDRACYRNTVSGVMTRGGTPNVGFYIFDWVGEGGYQDRLHYSDRVVRTAMNDKFVTLEQKELNNQWDVEFYEENILGLGHEGVILRYPDSPYKFGRSTTSEGYLLKLKRYHDSEGVIIGFEEEERNDNELGVDERGYAKRTSHKENKVGKGTLGALLIRDVHTFIESKIGSGFSDAEAQHIWDSREEYMGRIAKYKYFAIGIKDKPRHPVYLGLRPEGA